MPSLNNLFEPQPKTRRFAILNMTLLRKPSLVARTAITAAFLFASAQLALTQPPSPPPPPPPSGVAVQMPDKPDPSIKIPQFDVISVKPSKDNRTRVQFTPDGMRGTEVITQFLIFEGFGGINQNQVIGEPPWSTADGFDIEAKVAAVDVPTLARMTFEQRRTMFQQILADRFKLVAHHETRELPIYQLMIGKNSSRLKESAPDDPASTTPRRKGMMFGPGKVTVTDGSLSMFITALSRQLGRTIVDKSGLTGNYDFTLEWAPEGPAPPPAGGPPSGAAPPDQSGPDIFTAIQEQLGLKLESTKGPVDVLVIDHIEKPSAN
jgi:bla regulator protein blaR1